MSLRVHADLVSQPTVKPGFFIRFVDRFLPRDLVHATEDRRRQVRTAIGFLMGAWIMGAVFAASNFRQGFYVLGWIELGAIALLSFTIPMIRRTGRVELFGNIGMSSGVFTVFVACWMCDGLDAPSLALIPLIPTWAYLGFGRRSALAWSGVAVLGLVILTVGDRMGYLPPPRDSFEKLQSKRFVVATFTVGFGFIAANVFSNLKEYALSTLQKRTDELKEAHARIGELFDNMRQGVLAFDGSGSIEGPTSFQASKLFGVADLGGEHILTLLFGDEHELLAERDNFAMWLEAAFSSPLSDWDELLALTPARIVRNAGRPDERHLVLEFRPLGTDDGALSRVMLLITDDTERVRLERAARAADAAHRREVQELRKLVAGGAHLLLRFLEVTRERLDEIVSALHLSGHRVPTEGDVAVAFQHVHTVRGEARTFQLTSLEALCVDMEARLAPLRAVGCATSAADDAFRADMVVDVARARGLLLEAEKHLIEVSPIGAAVLDQITVQKSLLDEACALASEEGCKDSALPRAMDRLAARPFGESTQQLLDAVPLWAKGQNKRVELLLSGREALVPHAVSRILGGALTHLVRNAVAHGIELPATREQKGKAREGRVHLACVNVGDGAIVAIEDDGRGIDEQAVRRSARALGLSVDRPLHELLFEPGLSTSSDVSEIAGRGMGMGAVQRDLAAVGYGLRIESTEGVGTRIEIAPLSRSMRRARAVGAR